MKVSCCKDTKTKKILGTTLILVVFVTLCISAIKYTIGQAYYQQGKMLSENSSFSQAIDKLTKAASWQPKNAVIQHELGIVNLRIALNLAEACQQRSRGKIGSSPRYQETGVIPIRRLVW